MSENSPLSTGERVGIALQTVLRVALRLLLIIMIAVILGGIVYFAYYTVYQQAVLPARENSARIDILETSQGQDGIVLIQRLDEFQQRLAALEAQHNLEGGSLAELSADLSSLQAELDRQAVELRRLDDLQVELENVRSYADKAYNIGVQGYQATVGKDSLIAALQREIVVLKVGSLLNRSRLYLTQNNLGLARDQIVMARQLLEELRPEATDAQQPILTTWIGRLDSALDSLTRSPVVAGDELEIAWVLILEGLPEQFIPTPTPYIPDRSTTPTAIPTFTPPPPSFPTRTPTPFFTPTPPPFTYRSPTP